MRNLLHDRVRLAVTLTGVVFAVVLIAVQGGLFVGFTQATSCVIDNTDAALWVASRGVRNFDVAHPLPDYKFHQILGVPGVARAKRLIVRFANWKKPAGGMAGFEAEYVSGEIVVDTTELEHAAWFRADRLPPALSPRGSTARYLIDIYALGK